MLIFQLLIMQGGVFSNNKPVLYQASFVSAPARQAGIRSGDVIIGIDGQRMEMTMLEFLAHVRKNYLVGDRITLNIIRDGKRIDLPQTLR